MSICSFKLLCLNDLGQLSQDASSNALIFAGKAAPDFKDHDLNLTCHSLRGGYKLLWTVADAGLFPLNPSVSSSISSQAFQNVS